MKRYSPPPGKDGGVSWKGGVPGGRRGCLQKSGLCTQAASLPFFFFLLLLPGPQEIDTYIVQAKERSYETVLSFGKRGLNIAASAAVQAATKVPPPQPGSTFWASGSVGWYLQPHCPLCSLGIKRTQGRRTALATSSWELLKVSPGP